MRNLPTNHIPGRQSLLGVGATLLQHLDAPKTVTELWERLRGVKEVGTFPRLILALDLLYMMGMVEWHEGLVRRSLP